MHITTTAARRRRSLPLLATAVLAAALVAITPSIPAQAKTASTWGTLNCSGSTVFYNVSRYTSGSDNVEYRLKDSAGSQYGTDMTYLGIKIVTTGKYQGLTSMSLPVRPDAVLSSTYWLKNTEFTMYGKMPASDGKCDNYFSGTLYY
ncbi:hypothetical protein [Homoserinibacter sp. GY 40078]|uniref:hypothetical protein n=1 Tax=Homoserinibacter sp. GY 40078 TaxID=2603275 RepID=UPI0011C7C013|nr:hypothetical protein [Homoserinibacter sp. GY 40078]TXK16370.1 hypothetical protein FVQ89_14060 [Homoserinibacter sp. GY 40078]